VCRTFGQRDRAHIFLPGTQAVDFESMDLQQEFLEELLGERGVSVKAHAADIPERMVEDDQNLGVAIEPLEQFSKHLTSGVARVSRHFVPETNRFARREIVNPDVEASLLVRDRPLQRDRDVLLRSFLLKEQARVDIVVVRQGDDRSKIKLLDLPPLQIERPAGANRASPVGSREVQSLASRGLMTLPLPLEELRNDGHSLQILRQVLELFLRVHCMAVHRDSGAEYRSVQTLGRQNVHPASWSLHRAPPCLRSQT
jgi:hypothetical protein